MNKKQFNSECGGTITLACRDKRVGLTLRRQSRHVASVATAWNEPDAATAQALIERTSDDSITQEMQRLEPFSEFVNKLEEALQNGNTKKTAITDRRNYGGAATRRY